MRCLAMARSVIRSKRQVSFAIATDAGPLHERLAALGCEVTKVPHVPGSMEDAIYTAKIAKDRKASHLLLDGYHFSADYQSIFVGKGLRTLFVDDNSEQQFYHTDYVVNPNSYADKRLYPSKKLASHTQLLLGLKYCSLRDEFVGMPPKSHTPIKDFARVLVTLGGGDPDNNVLKVIQALQSVNLPIEATIVAGPHNPHYEGLLKAVRQDRSIVLIQQTDDMASLMAHAHIAISAGGGTAYELIAMLTPFLVIVTAENQRAFAEDAHAKGMALNLGWHEQATPADIRKGVESLLANSQLRSNIIHKQKSIRDTAFDPDWLARLILGETP